MNDQSHAFKQGQEMGGKFKRERNKKEKIRKTKSWDAAFFSLLRMNNATAGADGGGNVKCFSLALFNAPFFKADISSQCITRASSVPFAVLMTIAATAAVPPNPPISPCPNPFSPLSCRRCYPS